MKFKICLLALFLWACPALLHAAETKYWIKKVTKSDSAILLDCLSWDDQLTRQVLWVWPDQVKIQSMDGKAIPVEELPSLRGRVALIDWEISHTPDVLTIRVQY